MLSDQQAKTRVLVVARMQKMVTMAAFEHQERLRLSLTSPQHVIVELETTSILKCSSLKKCQTVVSPFRSDVLQLLIATSELKNLRWDSSSQSSSFLSMLSSRRHSVPSGVTVQMEFDETEESSPQNSKASVMDVLQRLQDDRLLMAPMGSISQQRLHRNILQISNETSYRIHLPMEGTAVTSEAFQAYLPAAACGLWGLGDAHTWSSFMLGSGSRISHSQRNLWMNISKECNKNDECTIILRQGIGYGRQLIGSNDLSLSQVLPSGRGMSTCPWTDKSTVEVTRPKSTSISIKADQIDLEETDLLRTTTHSLPPTLDDAFVRLADDSSSSWSGDITYGQIDKMILRANGMAHVGSLLTTVTNNDIYEARVSLYDVLPRYIRRTMIDLSLTNDASRSYQPLDDDPNTMLLQHDFILPPQSSARLTIDYDPVLLPFQRFPSDPNRGIEVPPSWAIWNATATDTSSNVLYSQSLLLLPPVPDMSMPFNIMSLTCTLYAFVIGSVINNIVRRSEDRIYYQLYPDKKPKSPGQKLKEKLRKIKERFLGRKTQQAEATKGAETEEKLIVEDDWIPEANLQDDGSDVAYLLTKAQRQTIAVKALPITIADRRWKRLYSVERDGDSFERFLDKVTGEAPSVIVVKTTKGHVFGGYADHEWKRQKDYYGSGQACLFQVKDESDIAVYKWTAANRMVQHIEGNKGRILMGGGKTGGLGLCIEDNFCRGSTSRCDTFNNEPLCPDGVFDVVSFEVYGFVRGAF